MMRFYADAVVQVIGSICMPPISMHSSRSGRAAGVADISAPLKIYKQALPMRS
jgi:hypothetical protein